MSNTPARAIRVDQDTWDAAMARAQAENRSLSDVIRIALRAYADDRYHAVEPRRKRK